MFFSSATGRLVYSASDLVTASTCEYATLVTLDDKLGRRPAPAVERDEMLERAARLGDDHEHRVLDSLIAEHGQWEPGGTGGVLALPSPGDTSAEVLEARRRETLDALASGADVVFQGTFWDGSFVGYADFLVRDDDGRYAVWDTKLARHAKTTALLQIAAYGDQLIAAGLSPADDAVLVLGDGEHSVHPLGPLMSVFRERRARFLALVDEHLSREAPVEWDQPGLAACGRCDYCRLEAEARDDLLLVARMSLPMRKKLRAAGVTTVAGLAGITARTLGASALPGPVERLRDQARMQSGAEPGDGHAPGDPSLRYRLVGAHTVGRLPAADAGDLFFDFEGDPMYQEGSDGSWGLEYLFGVVENDSASTAFRPFWAHSRTEERRAFLDFVDYVEERRERFPGMRVYHYAAYEKTALRNLSLRHGAREDTIDEWLRTGLLVDLLETVHASLRISADSYSIKRLEPFYMGEEQRVGDVTNAGASVVAYAHYTDARDAEDAAGAADILESIRAYNEYDCVSTLRLRDWLLELAGRVPADGPPAPAAADARAPAGTGDDDADAAPTAEEARLAEYLDRLPHGDALEPDQQAVAMVAAATGFHRRERKQYWWGHFDRLESDPVEWQDTRDVVVVASARALTGWEKPPRKRTFARRLSLRGTAGEGSDLRAGSTRFAMYAAPAPPELADPAQPYDPGARGGTFNLTVDEVVRHTDGTVTLDCTEKTRTGSDRYDALPMALAPGQPIRTASLEEALAEVAHDVGAALPALPATAALDLLTRTPPRLAGDAPLPRAAATSTGHDYVSAVTAAVLRLQDSYLAVQGPPGTGKTFLGSHVISSLVERGWKVGVVSQGHVTVDGMLAKAIGAGVDPARVAKKPKDTDAEVPWEHTDPKDIERLLSEPGGCLVGGTAWTMTGAKVPRRSLDLLVIDEAGQFSLANTLAVGQAARSILLLGDPQQLPQVTQGTHPVPVDESALGWLSAGHPTLPPEFGYFLADSWRMHPNLCRAVSRLSYDGQLAAAPAASERHLNGALAGVDTVLVHHEGNTVSSAEEAAAVVEQVRGHLGLTWQDGADQPPRHLSPEDFLVVAAYNAQVALLREHLAAAGLPEVRVGTVDKFQGQEAPVVIVSMACSSAADAPRGMDFLLNRNRLNVAVSRGKWRAVIVRSRQLTNFMPATPRAMVDLGAFLELSPSDPAALEAAAR